jgi:hypothetical protein
VGTVKTTTKKKEKREREGKANNSSFTTSIYQATPPIWSLLAFEMLAIH